MKENKTLNQKMEDLESKIEWFYSDEFNLDDAMEKYQNTMTLAKELQADLDKLKNKIKILVEDFSK